MISNIPNELGCEVKDNEIRFCINDSSTNWMGKDDLFVARVDKSRLNPVFLTKHLEKEIEIKNLLDEAYRLVKSGKYPNAIENLDKILFYDPHYGEALLYMSFALRGQKHFVKALRHYKKAVKADDSLKDVEYHRALLKQANEERDNFPKIKRNIYAGDEYFSKGEFGKAVESYDRALANPSKFKDRILSKLLNKKATALVKLNEYDAALECFFESLDVGASDYAIFGKGLCEFELGLDVDGRFRARLDITKEQMLRQVSALNDLGLFEESLKISDYLWQNHFRADEFYFKLISLRKVALTELGRDLRETEMFDYSTFTST